MKKTVKKFKGFTLVELIVVIGIISILAAILTPTFIKYVDSARIAKLNTNARQVYGAATYAIADVAVSPNCGKVVPNDIYTGDTSDHIARSNGGGLLDVSDYLSSDYVGSFAFELNSSGSCIYALWSNESISASDIAQLTQQDIERLHIGCYPIKEDP